MQHKIAVTLEIYLSPDGSVAVDVGGWTQGHRGLNLGVAMAEAIEAGALSEAIASSRVAERPRLIIMNGCC